MLEVFLAPKHLLAWEESILLVAGIKDLLVMLDLTVWIFAFTGSIQQGVFVSLSGINSAIGARIFSFDNIDLWCFSTDAQQPPCLANNVHMPHYHFNNFDQLFLGTTPAQCLLLLTVSFQKTKPVPLLAFNLFVLATTLNRVPLCQPSDHIYN